MSKPLLLAGTLTALALALPQPARAHCDTMNGPVVAAARIALEKGDVTPTLKWVKPEAEAEIRAAFAKALAVRAAGPQARELADLYFFETLVRVHRAGEGEPYTGLKPAGTPVGPAVEGADQALDKGSVDALVALVTSHIGAGMRERFAHASAAKQHADASVEQGRAFVAAYVAFVHYVESVHLAAGGAHAHHDEAATTTADAPGRK